MYQTMMPYADGCAGKEAGTVVKYPDHSVNSSPGPNPDGDESNVDAFVQPGVQNIEAVTVA